MSTNSLNELVHHLHDFAKYVEQTDEAQARFVDAVMQITWIVPQLDSPHIQELIGKALYE